MIRPRTWLSLKKSDSVWLSPNGADVGMCCSWPRRTAHREAAENSSGLLCEDPAKLKTCTTDIYLQNDCAHVGLSVHAPVETLAACPPTHARQQHNPQRSTCWVASLAFRLGSNFGRLHRLLGCHFDPLRRIAFSRVSHEGAEAARSLRTRGSERIRGGNSPAPLCMLRMHACRGGEGRFPLLISLAERYSETTR